MRRAGRDSPATHRSPSWGTKGLLRDHDADMRVVAADRVVLRPLMLTRLIDEFDIYPALDEALTDRR